MEYRELAKNTVTRLRELTKEHLPELKGVSGMRKEQLLEALAEKLGIERPHAGPIGGDKASIKAEIRRWKGLRKAAIGVGDAAKMKESRESLHGLRRQLRRLVKKPAG